MLEILCLCSKGIGEFLYVCEIVHRCAMYECICGWFQLLLSFSVKNFQLKQIRNLKVIRDKIQNLKKEVQTLEDKNVLLSRINTLLEKENKKKK